MDADFSGGNGGLALARMQDLGLFAAHPGRGSARLQ